MTSNAAPPPPPPPPPVAGPSKDRIKVGSKSIVCHDAELRGDVTIGSGCIIHPKCNIIAYAGPIVVGDGCIVEEAAVILNRNKATMVIGSYNLFETGCRIEASTIGSYNVFEPKSRVHSTVTIQDYCVIGAGCTVQADLQATEEDWREMEEEEARKVVGQSASEGPASKEDLHAEGLAKSDVPDPENAGPPKAVGFASQDAEPTTALAAASAPQMEPSTTTPVPQAPGHPDASEAVATERATTTDPTSTPTAAPALDHLPSFTVVYGPNSTRRRWSGEGRGQQVALMHKHLAYLSETLPRFVKLKLIT